MRKLLCLIIFLIPFGSLLTQELDFAKRLLKLANTNIWLEKFDEASNLVNRAKQILTKYNTWEAKYWDAVADETLGHIYLQMGVYDFAETQFSKAYEKYRKLVNSNYPGSQIKMRDLMDKTKKHKGVNKTELVSSNGRVINLSYTSLAGFLNLPEDLISFTAVECNLNRFPNELYGKKYLKVVALKGNRINNAVIREMPALEYLDLSENNLSELRIDTATVPKLKYLDLSNNRLKKIPVEILSLKELSFIDLTNNNIPFSEIANLIQNLPNTLVIYDRYELIEEEEE